MVYLITYDLEDPNDIPENYELIIGGIKKEFFAWCRIEKSVWLAQTDSDARTVRDLLKGYLHAGDRLFVGRLQGNWASWNLEDKRNDWLKRQTF